MKLLEKCASTVLILVALPAVTAYIGMSLAVIGTRMIWEHD